MQILIYHCTKPLFSKSNYCLRLRNFTLIQQQVFHLSIPTELLQCISCSLGRNNPRGCKIWSRLLHSWLFRNFISILHAVPQRLKLVTLWILCGNRDVLLKRWCFLQHANKSTNSSILWSFNWKDPSRFMGSGWMSWRIEQTRSDSIIQDLSVQFEFDFKHTEVQILTGNNSSRLHQNSIMKTDLTPKK